MRTDDNLGAIDAARMEFNRRTDVILTEILGNMANRIASETADHCAKHERMMQQANADAASDTALMSVARRFLADLPSIASIVADPEGAPVPNTTVLCVAVAAMVSEAMTADNAVVMLTYLDRLPVPLPTFAMIDAVLRDASVTVARAVQKRITADPHFTTAAVQQRIAEKAKRRT